MGLTQNLFGVARTIPETGEVDWGAEMTALLSAITYAVDGAMYKTSSNIALLRFERTTTTLAAGATLTPTYPWHHIQGDGGAVTLSAVTAIADGEVDGQLLRLTCSHATYSVTVPDGANTDLNGPAIVEQGQSLLLQWNATDSVWEEVSRRI